MEAPRTVKEWAEAAEAAEQQPPPPLSRLRLNLARAKMRKINRRYERLLGEKRPLS